RATQSVRGRCAVGERPALDGKAARGQHPSEYRRVHLVEWQPAGYRFARFHRQASSTLAGSALDREEPGRAMENTPGHVGNEGFDSHCFVGLAQVDDTHGFPCRGEWRVHAGAPAEAASASDWTASR